MVSDFEEGDLPLWRGLEPEYALVTEGESAGRWEHMDQVLSVTFTMPMDWSAYDALEFDCYSESANNDRFILCVQSMEEPRRSGHDDYWAYIFGVDWEGWRHFRIPFRRLLHMRWPSGWDKVTAIRMWANGWGMSANPDTKLVFDNMRLSEGERRTVPQGLVDDFEEGPWAWWWMDEGSVAAHSGDHCGQFPLNAGWRRASCNPLTTDWGPYRELRFWVYTEKLNGEVLLVHAGGDGGRLDAQVPLDGEGWREVVLPLTGNPGQVSSFMLAIRNLVGDDSGVANRELDPEAKLCFDDIDLK